MRYRQYLHQGKPTDRVDSTEGLQFGTPDTVGIAEVAAALGVPEDEITVGFSATEPAAAQVVIPPTPEVPEAPPKLYALLEAISTARDLTELKVAASEIIAKR